ncbi:hypothetical protein [Curtobacterium sp. MCBD17_026]|uniref:hypothetical protein n=1 Tax=Curtobacterium sp. MCBD17_026 TaxID=2175621 RepID=UPI000DA7A5FA|nr:hypothetical protein [Curtobacterium sp. MCBD17_026]WIB72591.1 hypothetical protein DEI85_17525 [Curtobacterium sp. MCBD17_026]
MSDRVRFADVIPYDTPSSLDALHGPSAGILTLPITTYWGPQREFDLSDRDALVKAYRNIVREGTTAVQESTLHAATLLQVWHDLVLPARCADAWESKFPELAGV